MNPERQLPHDSEAERTLLGSILCGHASTLDEARDSLIETDFYREAHRKIWMAACESYDGSGVVDVTTVLAVLRERGTLEQAGGGKYLGEIMSGVPALTNPRSWCTIIAEHARRRDAIRSASRLIESAFEESEPISDSLEAHQMTVGRLIDGRGGSHDVTMSQALKEASERTDRYTTRKGVTGVPFGMPTLDDWTGGGEGGQLVVIGGRPGSGKSSLFASMAIFAAEAGFACRYFPLEMSPGATVQRMMFSLAAVRKRRHLWESDWVRLSGAFERLAHIDSPIVFDDRSRPTAAQVTAACRRQWRHGALRLVIVDYLQRMAWKGRDKWEGVGENVVALKSLARELNCVVVLGSQMTRLAETQRPTLADFRGSAEIEAEADVVIALYPDAKKKSEKHVPTELILLKQREGPTGVIHLTFEREFTRFIEAPPDEEKEPEKKGKQKALPVAVPD